MLDCTSPSACLLPMMHLPISSLARAVKEAIVPVTLRHVACTYDTEWEKLFPLYPWNVFESIQREEVLLFGRITECLNRERGSALSSRWDNTKSVQRKEQLKENTHFFLVYFLVETFFIFSPSCAKTTSRVNSGCLILLKRVVCSHFAWKQVAFITFRP